MRRDAAKSERIPQSRDRARHEARTWLGRAGYDQLLREASARSVSVSECIRSCLEEYFTLRRELAEALGTKPGPAAESQAGTRLAHSLLDRLEQNVVKEIRAQEGRVDAVLEALRLVACMVDQAYEGLVGRLPDVEEEVRKQRIAIAHDAAQRWRRAVNRLHNAGGPECNDAPLRPRAPR